MSISVNSPWWLRTPKSFWWELAWLKINKMLPRALFLISVHNRYHPLLTTCHQCVQVRGRSSSAQLTVDSFLWQEKEREKDKIKEKEKESKEKEKDKKNLNGHAFSPIPVVGPISCSQCMKPFTNKDAYTCASKRHASFFQQMRLSCFKKASLFLVSCASHLWSVPH